MQKRTAQRAESQPLRRRQCGAPTGSGPCIVWMIDERRECAVCTNRRELAAAAPLPRRLSAQARTLSLFVDEAPAPAVDLFNAARRLKPSTLAGRRTPPEVETPPRTSGDEPKSIQLRMSIAPPARHTWSPLLLVRDALWRQACERCSLVRQIDTSGARVRTWFVLPDGVSIDVCPSCVGGDRA